MRRDETTAPRVVWLAFIVLLALAAVGCSPESLRTRGNGQGADVGNRYLGPAMNIHGPLNPLYGEPLNGQAVRVGSSTPTPAAK